jgi:hypothetical protein
MPFDTSLRNNITNPSKDFKDFLNQYFDDLMYGLRREQDPGILTRLAGTEKQVAENLILANLSTNKEWLIEAACELKIRAAISILKDQYEKTTELGTKLTIAKSLQDWIGFEDYSNILEEVMNSDKSFYKQDVVFYALALDRQQALRILFKGLTDKDDLTRWIAFKALSIYRKKPEPTYEENKYYTDELVYKEQQLFNTRLIELRSTVEKE